MADITKYEWYLPAKQQFDSSLTSLQQKLASLILQDEVDVTNAVELGSTLLKLEKTIEVTRKERLAPFKEIVDDINGFFKPYTDRVVQFKKDVASKIDLYRAEQRKRAEELARQEEERLKKEREAERRKQLEEAKKLGETPPPIAPKIEPIKPIDFTPKTIAADKGKATERITWDFEIVDVTKIPREYLTPDEKKIRKVVVAGIREISGVRIFSKSETIFST